MTKVFFCEETPHIEVFLRRFVFSNGEGGCSHDATSKAPIGRFDWPVGTYLDGDMPDVDRGHALWPKLCDACGYAFKPKDEWQAFQCRVMRRADTGEELPVTRHLHTLPVGAVFESWWSKRVGADGRSLSVITPGGQWDIDSRASNCTKPNDDEHRCWVRHGRPEDGTLHVDKVGLTCEAGAGSIIAGDFHGFLHHGELKPC